MKPIVRNTLAVLAGFIVGNIINMTLVAVGHTVFPMNINPADFDALAAFMETASSKYFIFPFLAHAGGTLIGAFIAALISKNRKVGVALLIGLLFLIGGVLVSFMVPAPSWFIAMDLVAAYIPMALVGALLAKSLRRKK